VIAQGTFLASGSLSGRTTAGHLVSGSIPATVRFSHPGGDPNVSDALPSGRGMAVKLRTDAGVHDLVGVSTPAFPVRDGASFLELLAARTPDPKTGAPDPDRMMAFVGAHPESLPALQAAMEAKVPASYASLTYNGLHTFFLVDTTGRRQPFRWSWAPVGGEAFLDGTVDPAFDLATELAGRLAGRPRAVEFDLILHLGEEGDPTGDPTAIWPERQTLVAGRLGLTSMAGDVEPIIFDPNNVTVGVDVADDDEILRLRSAAYGLSYSVRTAG
jgi:catalase